MENRSDRSPSYGTPLVATNTTSPIFSSLHYKHLKRRVVHHFPRERNLTLICFVSGVVFFFFSSIYIGSTYLQEHLQDEKFSGLGSLPNTRNKISKWSIRRFGVDVTEMGPPPRARGVQGTGADKAAFSTDNNNNTTTTVGDDQQVSQHSPRRHGVTIQEERNEELVDREQEEGEGKKSLRGGTAEGGIETSGNDIDSSGSGDSNSSGDSESSTESSSSSGSSYVSRVAKEWKTKLAKKSRNKDSRPKTVVNAIFNRLMTQKTKVDKTKAEKTKKDGTSSSMGKQSKQSVVKGNGKIKTKTTSTKGTESGGGGRKGGRTKGGGTLGGGF